MKPQTRNFNTASQKIGREAVIRKFISAYGIDIQRHGKGIRVRTQNYEGNPLAPEPYCYKITFDQWGEKKRFAFWPNTVGIQSY